MICRKNMAAWGRVGAGKLIFPTYLYRKNLKSSCQNLLNRSQYYIAEMFLWWPLTTIVQVIMIRQKTGSGAYFSLYIYIEKNKNLLVRNYWTDFNITLQEYFFGGLLPILFKPSWFVKNMAARGPGLFSLYIYIENFKNLLVRNHSNNFNTSLQEGFLGGSLPKLFKPSWFVEKHGR